MATAEMESFYPHYIEAFSGEDLTALAAHFSFPCGLLGGKRGMKPATTRRRLTLVSHPVSVRSLTMDVLEKKPGTKRPVIIRAATSLFARRGVDATSMREIADAAGVREAAIYRHFASKDEMSREIFVSWYGWYSRQLRQIVRGPGGTKEKVYGAARLELSAAAKHSEAFTYFCENEARFLRTLPAGVPRARDVFIELITEGQKRREVKAGDAGLLADMLSGALCAVALSSMRRRRGNVNNQLELVAAVCWAMIAA